MTAPSYLPTDAEELDELHELVGFDLKKPTSDAELDAAASDVCRHLARVQADRDRYQEAERAELVRIGMFYEARYQPLDLRIKQLEAIGAEIAQRATFPGKSKSRKVAFGSYGSRTVAERVSVIDKEKAIAWLRETSGVEALREKIEIDMKEARKLVLKRLAEAGEIPPGFDHAAGCESFFIKPEP